MADTPAGPGVAARLPALRTDIDPPVKSPLLFDLIRGPRREDCLGNASPWGDVLLDIKTGVSPEAGDLRMHLVGVGEEDRDFDVTLTIAGSMTGPASLPRAW
jgi:hypothetical protein